MACNFNCLFENMDFLRSHAVMYTVYLGNGARWSHFCYRPLIGSGYGLSNSGNLDDEGHSPTASLFKCDFSYSCAAVDMISTEIIRHVVYLQ